MSEITATPTELRQRIQTDLNNARKQRKADHVSCLTMINAALKQVEIDQRKVLSDPEIFAILEKMSKQRLESIEQCLKLGRADLQAKEQFENDLIRSYLPAPLDPQALQQIIEEGKKVTQAVTIKDMGKLMAYVKDKVQGRADMTQVSQLIKQMLAGVSQ